MSFSRTDARDVSPPESNSIAFHTRTVPLMHLQDSLKSRRDRYQYSYDIDVPKLAECEKNKWPERIRAGVGRGMKASVREKLPGVLLGGGALVGGWQNDVTHVCSPTQF